MGWEVVVGRITIGGCGEFGLVALALFLSFWGVYCVYCVLYVNLVLKSYAS